MRRLHAVLFALALLASGLSTLLHEAPAQEKAPQRQLLPKGFTAEYGVKYVPDGDAAQVLDIFYPEGAVEKPRPLLVWIHGGGWQGGNKSPAPYVGQLPRGYVVASVEYRFSQKAKFPAQIQDCQAAIRWLRANAKRYHIDPEHVGVGGASAGGHLRPWSAPAAEKTRLPRSAAMRSNPIACRPFAISMAPRISGP